NDRGHRNGRPPWRDERDNASGLKDWSEFSGGKTVPRERDSPRGFRASYLCRSGKPKSQRRPRCRLGDGAENVARTHKVRQNQITFARPVEPVAEADRCNAGEIPAGPMS